MKWNEIKSIFFMHKYPYAPLILLLWQTGGEGEHWHPERSSSGSFGTQRGIAVWGSDYGGPEDASDCHPPHYQLGQTEQTPPGQIQVRIELEEASRSVFSVFICTDFTKHWLTVYIQQGVGRTATASGRSLFQIRRWWRSGWLTRRALWNWARVSQQRTDSTSG